ncbi:MAG: hypothetical protein IK955_08770 [Clostridia bacterium]|nr:hypothetical protein [Clostridia bacterium]
MRVKVELNMANINAIERKIQRGIQKTADQVRKDVQQSETMPFKSGQLQNRSTFVDTSELADNTAYVVSDTPYARRLYFHPEYDFNKDENKNAGGKWFETYISGEKKDYAQKVFAQFMRGGK